MNLSASDFFYISVGLAIWVTVAILFWITSEIILVVRSLRTVGDTVKKNILGIESFNKGIQLGFIRIIKNYLEKSKKVGDINEKTK